MLDRVLQSTSTLHRGGLSASALYAGVLGPHSYSLYLRLLLAVGASFALGVWLWVKLLRPECSVFHQSSPPIYNLHRKLKNVRYALTMGHWESFGNILDQKTAIEQKVSSLEASLAQNWNSSNFNLWHFFKNN